MKVLFVRSGNANTTTGMSPITLAQGASLDNIGIDVEYYGIRGNGINGYLAAMKPLEGHIENREFDIIHLQYSLSAYAVTVSRAVKSIVV